MLISEVTKGGAADKAGLKAGDVIVQVDGKPISGVEELRDALNDNFTGDTRKVSLTIVRDHHEQTVNADLTRSPTWGEAHLQPPRDRAMTRRWRKCEAQGRPAPRAGGQPTRPRAGRSVKAKAADARRMAAPTPGADEIAQGPAQANAEPPRRAASRRRDLTDRRGSPAAENTSGILPLGGGPARRNCRPFFPPLRIFLVSLVCCSGDLRSPLGNSAVGDRRYSNRLPLFLDHRPLFWPAGASDRSQLCVSMRPSGIAQ